jgi:hypothetical protein
VNIREHKFPIPTAGPSAMLSCFLVSQSSKKNATEPRSIAASLEDVKAFFPAVLRAEQRVLLAISAPRYWSKILSLVVLNSLQMNSNPGPPSK